MSSGASQSALVTVGMPVYNGERWVAGAIDSFLAQTLDEFVLVLSDNASTDGTQAICERYATRDRRVQYSRNPANIGVFRNYDRVFELSSTRYFKWASCNDICKPRFLEACVSVLESRPDVVLAYPRTALFEDRVESARTYNDSLDLQHERPSDRLKALLSNVGLNNAFNGVIRSAMLRKTALNKVHTASDIDLIAELAMHGKFVEVPEMLFYRRMSAGASSIMVPESDRRAYFAHEPKDVLGLRQWKVELGFFSALWRVPMPASERAEIAAYLTRRLVSARRELWRELAAAMRAGGASRKRT